MKPIRALATLICLTMLTHAADLAGEYCIDNSEAEQKYNAAAKLAGQVDRVGVKEAMEITKGLAYSKECYQFQAGSKVSYYKEAFGAKVAYSGSYTQKGNSISITLTAGDEKQRSAYNKNYNTKLLYSSVLYGLCSKFVNDYDALGLKYKGVKRYSKNQQGFNECIKDQERTTDFVAIKASINSGKVDDGSVKEDLGKRSGNFSLAGNTLHELGQDCRSKGAYPKKGTKETAYNFDDSKQFCYNGAAIDKCGGKTYNPDVNKCENNILLSKCGGDWYKPADQYCFKNAIKDKELTDSRDGKKYRIAKIGDQTWMGENLSYGAKARDGEEKLYTWAEAMGISQDYNYGFYKSEKYWSAGATHKGICPEGWELPNIKDWTILAKALDGKEGSEEYGFLGGYGGGLWSVSESPKDGMGDRAFYYHAGSSLGDISKIEQLNIRCLQATEESKKATLAAAKTEPNESMPPTKSSNFSAKNSKNSDNSEAPTKKSNASAENSPDLFTWLFKNVNWGARLAYNGSTVLFEGQNYGLGHGAEAGIIANIPVPGTAVEISLMANGIYRKPYTKEIIDENSDYITSELTEYVGSIPIMLKYNISDFYIQAGAQIDVPLKKEIKATKGSEETYEEVLWRGDRDLGVVLGLGWNINKNLSLDIKAVVGVSEYNKDIGGYKLIQGNLGISYFFLKGGEQKKEAAAPTAAAAKDPADDEKTEEEEAPAPAPKVAASAKDPSESAKKELENAANKWIKELKSSPNTDNFTFEVSEPMDGEGSYNLKATSKVKIGECPAKSVWEIGYEGCDRYNNVPKDCKAITPKVITDYEGDNGC